MFQTIRVERLQPTVMWVTHIWVQCAQYFPFTLPSCWYFFFLSLKNRKDRSWQMWNVIPKLQLILIQNTPSSLMEVFRQKITLKCPEGKGWVYSDAQEPEWPLRAYLSWVPWKFRHFLKSLCICLGCQFESVVLFISVQTSHSEILPCFVGFVCLSKTSSV